jgi:hypothetical protein
MNLDGIVKGIAQSGDPGAYLKQEISEGISPITDRVDRLEKKIDMLVVLMKRVDDKLKKLQPLYNLIVKLPFLKK